MAGAMLGMIAAGVIANQMQQQANQPRRRVSQPRKNRTTTAQQKEASSVRDDPFAGVIPVNTKVGRRE